MDQNEAQNLSRFPMTGSRGQSSVDLLLAITTFFTALVVVIVISPHMFLPGGLSATDETTTADSIRLEIHNTALASNTSPGLDHEKVVAFFSGSDTTIIDSLSIPSGHQTNVSLIYIGDESPPTAFNELGYWKNDQNDPTISRGPPQKQPATTVEDLTTLNNQPVKIKVTIWTKNP